MIKIYIEGESPLAAIADFVAAAHYFADDPAVSAAARNVIAADEKSLGLMARRETNSLEVLNLGSQPRHHAPDPDTSQHIFITQREETPSGGGTPQNPNRAASAPGVAPNPNPTAPIPGVVPNPTAPNGYPNNGAAQTPPPNGYPGNGAAQNPPPSPNGYGYPPSASGGVPGAPQANPTAGRNGQSQTTTQTSLFNGQPPANPGAGPIPVSPAPAFTVEQVGRAGADLVTQNPAKHAELNALLQRYGVQSVSELRPEFLGQFAQELRGLGARI